MGGSGFLGRNSSTFFLDEKLYIIGPRLSLFDPDLMRVAPPPAPPAPPNTFLVSRSRIALERGEKSIDEFDSERGRPPPASPPRVTSVAVDETKLVD